MHPFTFAGCIGPISLDDSQRKHWVQTGRALAKSLGLRGLFGIDAIWSRARGARPTVLEINPRFTASMELYDRALVVSSAHVTAMSLHMSAFLAAIHPRPAATRGCVGKFIIYAECDTRLPVGALQTLREAIPVGAQMADIPRLPQTIAAGHPVTTVIGRFANEEVAAAAFGLSGAPAGSGTSPVAMQRQLGRYQTKTDCMP